MKFVSKYRVTKNFFIIQVNIFISMLFILNLIKRKQKNNIQESSSRQSKITNENQIKRVINLKGRGYFTNEKDGGGPS